MDLMDNIAFAPGFDSPELRQKVRDSGKLRAFLQGARDGFDFHGGMVRDVVWFGQEVGMILFQSNVLTRSGDKVPGHVTLIRGDASAVLAVLSTPDGQDWTVLVHQPRLATGRDSYAEIPAGMVDNGVFGSTALRELEEETGLQLPTGEDELRLLNIIYPSPGGSDERIALYATSVPVSHEMIAQLQGRQAGLAEEGEKIRVEVIPLHDLPRRAGSDGKSLLAYQCWCATQGLVAEPVPPPEVEGVAPVPARQP